MYTECCFISQNTLRIRFWNNKRGLWVTLSYSQATLLLDKDLYLYNIKIIFIYPGTAVFHWILRNFQEHLFYKTPPGDCFRRYVGSSMLVSFCWFFNVWLISNPRILKVVNTICGVAVNYFSKNPTIDFRHCPKYTNCTKNWSFPLM